MSQNLPWAAFVVIALAWHLLMLPLVCNKKEDRFLWLKDGPMADWYYKRESSRPTVSATPLDKTRSPSSGSG